MNKYEILKDIIKNSSYITVFTGAGISCPPPTSIKDFRSSDGLYNQKTKYNIPPEDIISHSFFVKNPKEFFEFYWGNMVFKNAQYNLAHKFIADLEKEGKAKAVITQNIDGLHQKAGNKNVIELHGSVWRNYCQKCHKFYSLTELEPSGIPYCNCGGIIKPDVVLYEESLDNKAINEAIKAIALADTLIVIGTSLTVYPAAGFISYFQGKNLVLINKQKTSYDSIATLIFNEDIIEVIKKTA